MKYYSLYKLSSSKSSWLAILVMLLVTISAINPSYGQRNSADRFHRVISTNKYNAQKFKEDKEYSDKWVVNETAVLAGRDNHKIVPEGFTLTIVFHALYTDDAARVTQDVDFQLAALNRDFGSVKSIEYSGKHPASKFVGLATSPNIRFELQTGGQSKLTFDGISVIEERSKSLQEFDDLKAEIKQGAKAITPNKVINVWVVKSDDRLGSFAQMPGGPSDVDGIVIDYRVFGKGTPPFDQGKTLTHLIGNYLGLIDLWGIYPCQDDGVKDTPVHNSPNFNLADTRHISSCPGSLDEMTINFMDAMPDKDMWMFTAGQVKRMHHMLSKSGPRNQLAKN